MTSLSKDSSILIIGGGTWGCSSALHLARRGYKNVTVLEAHPIPSPISAGNDVNKIMEEGEPSENDTEEQYVWNRMHQITTKYWKEDHVFKSFYHPTGIIFSAISDDVYEHVKGYTKGTESEWISLDSPEDFKKTMPEGVLQGDFPGWRGFWKDHGAGWVFARGAMMSAYEEASKLGVKFVTGDSAGKVTSLLYSESKDTVLGAKTADGTSHHADQIILCAGANGDLLFDFEQQLRPTAWTLAHIPLSVEEAAIFKDLPVLYNPERGFFVEPDAEKRELKFCDEHPGYINMVKNATPGYSEGTTHSQPFARHQIPVESETRMRKFLQEAMPQIANRDFSFARICWDADTVDRQFLIDRPEGKNGLVVAAGGSGMGFMMMPVVGQLIVDRMEDVMEEKLQKGLRWRPEQAVGRDWQAIQDRHGGEGKIMDFHDVKGWTSGKGDKEPNIDETAKDSKVCSAM
ncbi:fructosyl amine:oxygen oxidoreductase [Aureobasidium pullulans EXF-150]|uniref:Fructosyl amine:oxygen oxidoreductase n=1 Tax=Aureobasidium pullulans EXF-150 TaxID=1043002 RepID=A0A074X8K2_AURPU|nr:fructosyl amine:oxygen oxidoreductase [Aureobasidium pullulans EXF-150]KEQ78377.1 fructosyl amine:oxygen oxidoreductase [Aureobasidium pullulans EXF-150]